MTEKVKTLLGKTKIFWTKLDNKSKKKIMFFSMIFVIFITVASVVLNTTEYAVLYSELSLKEAGEITAILKDLNIATKTSRDGTILIDKKSEENVRMQLAMQGYPKSGLNYDIYQNSMNFATSNQDKKIMLSYQLQDRLSNTISQLEGIKNAIVTITIEENDVFKFKDEISPVTACVVLDLENYFSPSQDKIKAIIRLMVTSVSGLKEENVAIIDSGANDLTPMNNSDPNSQATNNRLILEKEIENQITEKVSYLFGPVFGDDNIKIAVKVSVNLDKKVTEILEYSPVIDDEGIPYIIDELSEKVADSSQNSSQVNSGYAVNNDSLNDRMTKVINYRVNELRQTIDEAQGSVEDISVSILINNSNMDNIALDDIKKIAAAAVGIDTTRITVGTMEFTARNGLEEKIDKALNNSKKPEMPFTNKTIVELICGLLAFVFGLLLLRLLKNSFGIKAKKLEENNIVYQEEHSKQLDESLVTTDDILIEKPKENNVEERIIKEIEILAENDPENIARVISYWIREDN